MSLRYKILLFLYSTPHLVGSLLALLALGAFFLGLIGDFWFFIVIGLYLIGIIITPKNQVKDLKLSGKFTAQELSYEISQLVKSVNNKLSQEVQEALTSLKNKIVQILPLMDTFEGNTQDIHTLRQTITTYLPQMLQNYLNLPPTFARFHKLENGHTPKEELLNQIQILDQEMEKIMQNLLKGDVASLRAHGKFLQEKYQKHDWLK